MADTDQVLLFRPSMSGAVLCSRNVGVDENVPILNAPSLAQRFCERLDFTVTYGISHWMDSSFFLHEGDATCMCCNRRTMALAFPQSTFEILELGATPSSFVDGKDLNIQRNRNFSWSFFLHYFQALGSTTARWRLFPRVHMFPGLHTTALSRFIAWLCWDAIMKYCIIISLYFDLGTTWLIK